MALIRPVDQIGFGLGPAIPDALLTRVGQPDRLGGPADRRSTLPEPLRGLHQSRGRYRCGFFGPAERLLHSQGHRVELVPGGFRQMGPIMARFAPRVMVVQAAPPDGQGRVNLSLHVGGTRDELLRAGRDPTGCSSSKSTRSLPRTGSLPPDYDNTIPLDIVDVLVESDGTPFALEEPPGDDVDEAIAANALSYVRNGSTLQTGIGAIPNIVAAELAQGPLGGFGVHSEMFTTGLMRLHQAGKVTNDAKGVFDGVSVTTFALGVAELYDGWTGMTTWRSFRSTPSTTPPSSRGNANLVSINGALSVDLYGQVMADNIDGRQISGVGGHEDFVAGAELHLDAHSLICLRSTAVRDGEARLTHCGRPARRVGGLHASPSHGRRDHRIRRRGARPVPHRARAGASSGRHRPPGFPPCPAQGGRRAQLGLTGVAGSQLVVQAWV